MSNGNVYERLWKLQTSVMRLVMDGKRDPEKVANALQSILEGPRKLHQGDNVISFEVTSDGTTGEGWKQWFTKNGTGLSRWASLILSSWRDFRPTYGVKYQVIILPGNMFEDTDRVSERIRAMAIADGLATPPVEVACLIRAWLMNKKKNWHGPEYIVVMHNPVTVQEETELLAVSCSSKLLSTGHGSPQFDWPKHAGFAFILPQNKKS